MTKDITEWGSYKFWEAHFKGIRPHFSSDIDAISAMFLLWDERNIHRGWKFRRSANFYYEALMQFAGDKLSTTKTAVHNKFKTLESSHDNAVNEYYEGMRYEASKREAKRNGEKFEET